jgi:hypothetical protein
MRNRLPVVLSAAALVVAVLGVTPVGQATSDSIQTHFARNASFLRGRAPSIKAGKNKIPAAGPNGKLHASWSPTGRAGPVADALPSGKTIRGNYSMGGTAAAVGHLANASLSFDFALSAAPRPHIILQGAAVPMGCSGNATFPGANPGHLCIFETQRLDNAGAALNDVNRSGATILINASAGGGFYSYGTWAVTAP